jgi:predicted phosphodiesterase
MEKHRMKFVSDILLGKIETSQEEAGQLCGMVRDLYYDQPNIVDIPLSNVFFVGDLHGDLACARSVVELTQRYKNHSFVFLGDYGDRGPAQVETINTVMALAVSEPDRIVMLRGNHESDSVASVYGFFMDVSRKYSDAAFREYSKVFTSLPLGAMSIEGVFACHGGVPEVVDSLGELQRLQRHDKEFTDDIVFQLVWNDPKEGKFRFQRNVRSTRARTYGLMAFVEFLDALRVSMVFRAHEVFPEGVKTFFGERLVSVFSATYGGAVKPKAVRLGNGLKWEAVPLA